MKRLQFSTLSLVAGVAVFAALHSATGQNIVPAAQVSSPGTVAARPVASKPIAPQIAARPAAFTPQRFNANAPRTIGQPVMNVRTNYSPSARSFNSPRTLNPTFATLKMQRAANGDDQQPITLDPATRQRELQTLAAMRVRQRFGPQNRTLATTNPQQHFKTDDPAIQRQPNTRDSAETPGKKQWHNKNDHRNYADAFRCHWHEWHDRNWWHDHCQTIVFVATGYYFLDGSYWYPAWGYDPLQTSYDYDGPVYTYGNLLPDEMIANVQTALQDGGYYSGPITGSLSLETRTALANFQRDYGLSITGAVDEPTAEALGLSQADDNYQTDQGY